MGNHHYVLETRFAGIQSQLARRMMPHQVPIVQLAQLSQVLPQDVPLPEEGATAAGPLPPAVPL